LFATTPLLWPVRGAEVKRKAIGEGKKGCGASACSSTLVLDSGTAALCAQCHATCYFCSFFFPDPPNLCFKESMACPSTTVKVPIGFWISDSGFWNSFRFSTSDFTFWISASLSVFVFRLFVVLRSAGLRPQTTTPCSEAGLVSCCTLILSGLALAGRHAKSKKACEPRRLRDKLADTKRAGARTP
jgi:hypothetical protein